MSRFKSALFPFTAILTVALAACGGGAAPAAAPASPASAGASAKPAGNASAKPASAKLTVAFSEIYQGQTPVWVTQEAGIFRQNGLDVELTYIQSAQAIQAVVAGEVQIAQGGGSEALSASAEGADLVVLGNIVPQYPYVLEVTKEINTLDDLRGKKVGVSNIGSASDIATRVALKKENLIPDKDVSIVTVGSSQNRTAALQSGAIQGGLAQPPDTYILEAQGLHQLIDMTTLNAPTVNNGIVAKRSWVSANKDTVQKYIDSIVQGLARTKADKPFAAQVLAKNMKLDEVTNATKAVEWATTRLYPTVPTTKPADFADAVEVLSAKSEKVRSFDVTKLIDNSFVQSAVDRGIAK